MSELDEKRLEWLLRQHLTSELDPQLGRALAAFRAAPGPQRPSHWWLHAGWISGAVAACVAVGILAYAVNQRTQRISPTAVNPPTSAKNDRGSEDVIPVAQSVAWSTRDEGTIMLDGNQPVRQLRRNVVQQMQWYDPELNSTIELTVPQEQVMLIGMQSY
jgi:hypothetical protein